VARISADIVDAYVFRRHNAFVQFLLLQRHPDLPFGRTWHGIHGRIEPSETAIDAAARAVHATVGLSPIEQYSADYINQFFDHGSDAIILAPVFAFTLPTSPGLTLSAEFVDYAWCDIEEATARLMFAGQRAAVRHIEEIIGMSGDDAEYYRIL
jgi:dihydroneopterin triphosphate diphosphatase